MKLLDEIKEKFDKDKKVHTGTATNDVPTRADGLSEAQAVAKEYEMNTEGAVTPMDHPRDPMATSPIAMPNSAQAGSAVTPTRANPSLNKRAPSISSTVSGSASMASVSTATEVKRINKWRDHFHDEMDPEEQLITDYSCALSENLLLIQGHMYVSQRHIAFGSGIMGLKRHVCFQIKDITGIRKKMTAKIIPNGLTIDTSDASYTFATLNTRDATHDLITDLWRAINPEAYAAFMTQQQDAAALGSPDAESTAEDVKSEMSRGDVKTHPATQPGSKRLKETVLDIRLPTSPQKAFELIFRDEEFFKKFATETMKLRDLDLKPWEGEPLKRTFSYVKPLSGSVGPKETKCYISEEEQHSDPETYLEMLTTTKTPDVPSGDAFEITTKTSCYWAGGQKGGCVLLVTTDVNWSGRSMLKGVITKASIDGQRQYHKDLAHDVRAHIKAHAAQFKSGENIDEEADDELDEQPELEQQGKEEETFLQQVFDGLLDIPNQPALLLMTVFALILLISNIVAFVKLAKAPVATAAINKLDASALARLERLEEIVDRFREIGRTL